VRELSHATKIQAMSCAEIHDGLEIESRRLGRRGLKWKRTVGNGPLMNFILAWYFTRSDEERERIARAGKIALEEILSREHVDPANPAAPQRVPAVSKINGRGGSSRKMAPGNDRYANKPVG
jgi:hypothetical protein